MGLTRIPLATLEWRDQWGTSLMTQVMKMEAQKEMMLNPRWFGVGPNPATPLWFWLP